MKSIFTFLLMACIATLNMHAQYVASVKGNVNLRASASTSAAKVGTLAKGDLRPCLEELDGWYKIEFEGKPAYVSQSVTRTWDETIPTEIYKKGLTSNEPKDKIRFQGDLTIEPIDKSHVLITENWMRTNLPAETIYYLGEVKDGKILATYGGVSYVETDTPIATIKEELGKLDNPLPLGFDEFNMTIFFNGVEYSEFE